MKILATDGIAQSGIDALEEKGFEVLNVNIATGQLENLEFVTVILYQPANSDSGGGRQ